MSPSPTPCPPRGLLFLCVANSARSQLAEGWARALAPAGTPVYSAGSEPGRLNPYAVAAMREVGIDIADQRSKGLDEVPLGEIRTVVTLCADEVCPTLPEGVERLHWPFADPAGRGESEEQALGAFRDARDAIGRRLRAWLAERA